MVPQIATFTGEAQSLANGRFAPIVLKNSAVEAQEAR